MKEWLDDIYNQIENKVTDLDNECWNSDVLDHRAKLRKQAGKLDDILRILADFDDNKFE